MATFDTFTGNGTKVFFDFTFEYLEQSDVKVSLNGTTQPTTAYFFSTDTRIQFNTISAATTLQETTGAPKNGVTVRVFRETDITELKSTFFAGSAIRSQDLNDNFNQNNFAVEEVRDQYVTRTNGEFDTDMDMNSNRITELADPTAATDAVNRQYLEQETWDNETQTLHSDETWTDVDTQIATSKAIENRISEKIDSALETDVLVDSTGLNKTGSGGQVTLGISANSVDFDRIKNSDIISNTEQNAGSPAPADNNIFTALAAKTRHDALVQTGTPGGSTYQTGKLWYQNDNDKTLHMWDGSAWSGITSGGTFTKLEKVIYVDSVNGDDTNEGHRISNPKATIKAAVDAINNDATFGDGSVVLVAPGIYQETAPIDIQKRDVAIIGASVRNVIVHPTAATETNSLFRVNSGTYLHNMTFTGVKASGTRGATGSLWEDSTYGLPPTQGWNVSFFPDAMIYKSPYIQNCTNFSDSEIDNSNLNFYAGDEDKGRAGDLDHAPTGGGLLVDGSTVHDDSPLRSMVADSYTHTALDGPGIFVTNNGYTQITSSYAFFNHFHIACINGGQANLAASTTDFGRFSLIADGKSTTEIFAGLVKGTPSSGDITFTVDGVAANASWHGSSLRPASNMLVEVGGNLYPILSSTVVSSTEFTVTISRPDSTDRTQNLGLSNSPADNSAVKFYLRSMVASSGHTMEYVGAGVDYRALPEYAAGTYELGAGTSPNGVHQESHQKVERNDGKVWAAITDHNGKFRVGDTFSVNQQSGFVSIPAGALSVNTLLEDLNVNGKEIKSVTTNQDIVLNPNGTGVVNVSTSKITNVVDPTSAQDAATKNYVDSQTTSTTAELNILDGATLNTSELNTLDGITASTTELNQLDGKSITTTFTGSNTNDIPTSSAVNSYVVNLFNALGGFVAIANETSFPNSNPDPQDGAGTVVSIADAGGLAINGSGVATGQTLNSTTVTINGFPSHMHSETLAAGLGVQVQTTTTEHTYTFHKLIPKDTDILRLSDDINDFNNRYRVSATAPTTSLDGGDLWFDTTAGKMKVYDATDTAWEEVQSIGNFFTNTLSSSSGTGGGSATFNGSAFRFTLSNAPTMAEQLVVSINGVIQKPNSGSSQPSEGFAIDNNDIIFSAAPAANAPFFIITLGSTVNIGQPSNNTVNTSELVDGAVTNAKVSSSAAIAQSKLNLSITNAEVNASAAIASSKLAKPIDFADNEKARFGTGNDLEIYHDGNNSYISDSGTGNLTFLGSRILFKNAADNERMLDATENGAVEILYDNSVKLATKSDGIDVTGEVQCDSLDVDGAADITGNVTLHANLDLQDNDKILLGASDDLQIYHSGAHSFIDDTGTGQLAIRSSQISFEKYTGEQLAKFTADDSCELYHNNSKKFETKSNGVRVYGEVHSDGLDVDGDADIAGTVRINQLIVDDDGSGDPTLSVRGDDGNPWGFVVGNDTYSSNLSHGYKIYQDNSGNIHQQWRGDGEFTNFYLNAANGTASEQVFHVDTNRAVFLKYQGNERLTTTSSGVSITGTLSGNGSGLTNTGGLKSIQVFASVGTTTWTKPTGINKVKVYVTGGGGGGGGANVDDVAGGGGAGGTAIEIIDVSSVSSVSVTVGGGGAGAAVNVNSSSPGGTSSFGSYCSATGGDRYGGNWSLGGPGGSATGGSYNIPGGDGQGGNIDQTGVYIAGGTGGASFWGGGGRGAIRQSETAARNGQAWGSGGGGAANSQTSKNGKQGIVIVEEYA